MTVQEQGQQPEQEQTQNGVTVQGVLRAVVFGVLVFAMVVVLSIVLTPSGARFGDAKDTIRGLYDQPKGTVQVVAVGASTMRWGFSPDYLYETYGVSAYDCCTSAQSPMVGYYLLKEALRVHGDSITLALVDMGPYVKGDNPFKSTDIERAIINMDMSPIKLELIADLKKNFKVRLSEQLVPLLRYHERWDELDSGDFKALVGKDYETFSHGQNLSYESNATRHNAGGYTTEKNDLITTEIDTPMEEIEALYDDLGLYYLDKIVELCKENNLDILFMKTPASMWTDKRHDAGAYLAEKYGVDYLDMSIPSIRDACGVSYDLDYYDSKHANVLGSLKITDYLGNYLVNHFELDDVRGQEAYSFMDADLERYAQAVEDAGLARCTTLESYLALLDKDRYTIFVSVKSDAAENLSDEARAGFAKLGFEDLSTLRNGESYVGVVDGGARIAEAKDEEGAKVVLKGSYQDGRVIMQPRSMQAGASFDRSLEVVSIARDGDARSDIMIDGDDVSESKPGINFAVYNRESGTLLDTSCFDTHLGSDRTTDLV